MISYLCIYIYVKENYNLFRENYNFKKENYNLFSFVIYITMPPPKDETAEQREARLIKARKKASNVREEKMIEKYKNKVLEKVKTEKEENENEDEDNESDKDEEVPDKLLKPVKEPKPMPVKEPKEPKEPKAPKKKQSKVIIEQSSDDEDVFEDKPNVIFVKRVRPKPKEPITPSAPIQQPSQQQQQQQQPQQFQQQQRPPQQLPPQRPALTPEKRLEMQRYINMTQGNFLPVCRPR